MRTFITAALAILFFVIHENHWGFENESKMVANKVYIFQVFKVKSLAVDSINEVVFEFKGTRTLDQEVLFPQMTEIVARNENISFIIMVALFIIVFEFKLFIGDFQYEFVLIDIRTGQVFNPGKF